MARSRHSLDALRRFNHAADELYCMLQKEAPADEFGDICYEIYKFRMAEEVASGSEERLKEKLVA